MNFKCSKISKSHESNSFAYKNKVHRKHNYNNVADHLFKQQEYWQLLIRCNRINQKSIRNAMQNDNSLIKNKNLL